MYAPLVAVCKPSFVLFSISLFTQLLFSTPCIHSGRLRYHYYVLLMSLQLTVRSRELPRYKSRGNARNLVNACKPLESSLKDACCDAIETDGRRCHRLLSSEDQIWCDRHRREQNNLNLRWKRLQCTSESITVIDAHTAKLKVFELRLAVELRRQIRERFRTRGIDTADFVEWIAKLEEELRTLVNMILSASSMS
jgi:hypothetical protein